MTKQAADLEKGEKVAWNWGAGQPTGTVKDVVEGEAKVKTKRGNEVTRKGDEKDPAVVLEADSGNNAIKSAHELVGVETNDKGGSGSKKPASKGGKPASKGGNKPASKGAASKPASTSKKAEADAEDKKDDDAEEEGDKKKGGSKEKKEPAKKESAKAKAPKKEPTAPTRSAPKRAAASKGAAKTSKHASGDNEPDNVDEDEGEAPKKKMAKTASKK